MQEYEKDFIFIQKLYLWTKPSNTKEVLYKKTIKLIQSGQLKKVRQMIMSNSCRDSTLPHIMKQMESKFPEHKQAIPTPTETQFQNSRPTISFDELKKVISSLKPQVAPGLGGFRNEHLTALLFNDRSNTPPQKGKRTGKLQPTCPQ